MPVSMTNGVGVGSSGAVSVGCPGVVVAGDELPGVVGVGPGTMVVGPGVTDDVEPLVGVLVAGCVSVGVGGIGASAVGARSDTRGVDVGVGESGLSLPPQATAAVPRSIKSAPTIISECLGSRRRMRIVLAALF